VKEDKCKMLLFYIKIKMTTTEYKDINTNTHLELEDTFKIKIKRGVKHTNKTLTKTGYINEKSHIRPHTTGGGNGVFLSKEILPPNTFEKSNEAILCLQDLEINEMRPSQTPVLPPIIQPYDNNIKNSIIMQKQTNEDTIQYEEPKSKIHPEKQTKYPYYENNPDNNYRPFDIDLLLEQEKQYNKTENWNKLDKMRKIQKLNYFANKYAIEQNLNNDETRQLKIFLTERVNKQKLQKAKDVIYNKDTKEIISIPSLYFNTSSHNFSLRIMDPKRVSTLKSLTPKREIAMPSCNSTL